MPNKVVIFLRIARRFRSFALSTRTKANCMRAPRRIALKFGRKVNALLAFEVNERSSPLRLSCLETPTPPDRGDISGQSTRFSTTNTALRAVKETEEHDESHVDFTRECGKSPVTTSTVFHCVYLAWKHPPTPPDRGGISGDLTDFFTTNTALRAVKGTEKHNKLHIDLTRQ